MVQLHLNGCHCFTRFCKDSIFIAGFNHFLQQTSLYSHRIHNSKKGVVRDFQWSILKQLLLICCLTSLTTAELENISEREALSPSVVLLGASAIPELPLPANTALFQKHRWKHPSPYGSPSQPPNYDHFLISAPPLSSVSPTTPMKKSGSVTAVTPTQSGSSNVPAGLAQPPLSPRTSSCMGHKPSRHLPNLGPIERSCLAIRKFRLL